MPDQVRHDGVDCLLSDFYSGRIFIDRAMGLPCRYSIRLRAAYPCGMLNSSRIGLFKIWHKIMRFTPACDSSFFHHATWRRPFELNGTSNIECRLHEFRSDGCPQLKKKERAPRGASACAARAIQHFIIQYSLFEIRYSSFQYSPDR